MKRYIRANTASPFIYDGTQKVPKDVTEVIVADGVTSISDWAFYDCSNLESITIPDSVTSIGIFAFRNCTALSSIIIPQGVTSIGSCAFARCTSLSSITLPQSVTSIGDYAFEDCFSLSSITILDSVTSIGYKAFANCTSLSSITIPNSVTSIGDSAFSGCDNLVSVDIPSSVTEMGHGVFDYCEQLDSKTLNKINQMIPNSVDLESEDYSEDSFASKQSKLEDYVIDWEELSDSFYQDFCDKAYEMVENEGFTDVFTEPSTQGGVGSDYFTAYSNGERYSGSYDFESEQETLMEIYLGANSYEEACDTAAKWYAQTILDNLELDEE